jgi:CheY-like chemotaxis protein
MDVLIADDDKFICQVLQRTLTRQGYHPIVAQNGHEALRLFRRGDIHLVITDWDMPEMNGLDLCQAIRQEDGTGYAYVIMLTGREGPQPRLLGLNAGVDDFLCKPLNTQELIVCLKRADRILSLETRDLALFALAKLAESRDPETGAHVGAGGRAGSPARVGGIVTPAGQGCDRVAGDKHRSRSAGYAMTKGNPRRSIRSPRRFARIGRPVSQTIRARRAIRTMSAVFSALVFCISFAR